MLNLSFKNLTKVALQQMQMQTVIICVYFLYYLTRSCSSYLQQEYKMTLSTAENTPQVWWRCQALRYRLDVFSRFTAAVLGGYTLTAALTAVLPLILPLRLSDAVLLTLSLSVLFYSLAFVWVFWVKTSRTAWAGMLLPSMAFGLLLVLRKGWL
jgi:hypothetical protein